MSSSGNDKSLPYSTPFCFLKSYLQMTIWNQLRDAVRMQLEDFFSVRAQTVLAMLAIVAVLILYAWVRTTQGGSHFFGLQGVLLCVVLILTRFVRR